MQVSTPNKLSKKVLPKFVSKKGFPHDLPEDIPSRCTHNKSKKGFVTFTGISGETVEHLPRYACS